MERAATPNMILIVQKELPGAKNLKLVIMLTNRDALVNLNRHLPDQKPAQHRNRQHRSRHLHLKQLRHKQLRQKKQQAC